MGILVQYIGGFGTFDFPFSAPFTDAPFSAISATLKQVALATTAPLNPGDSVSVQVLVGGTPVGSVVTLTNPNQSVVGNFGSVVIPAMANPVTDLVRFRVIVTGSPPSDIILAVNYDAGGDNKTILHCAGALTYAFTGDLFFNLSSGLQVSLDNNVVESAVQFVWPTAGKFENLAMWLIDNGSNVTAPRTVQTVLRINGIDTLLGVTGSISPGGNVIYRDDIHQVSVSPGDLVSVRTTIPVGSADSWHGSMHLAFTAS